MTTNIKQKVMLVSITGVVAMEIALVYVGTLLA